ncbi:MAG TPA: hypothetical protein VKF82_06780 [Candidatus Eremiobacteraceae bacterium]|nr:hypothetical protein [Candidatus Eremiobacteraceae bacterium]
MHDIRRKTGLIAGARRLPELRQIEISGPLERLRRDLDFDDAIAAEHAHLLVVARGQIPDARFGDESERFGDAVAHGRIAIAIAKPDPPVIPHRATQRGQMLAWSHGLFPAARIEEDQIAAAFCRAALRRGQRAGQLFKRLGQAFAETDVGQRVGGSDEERADLILAELGERAAIAVGQADAAPDAALRVDRDAGCAQGVDVAMDRALRDLEPFSQRRRGERTAGLQEQQKVEEAA